MGAVSAGGRKGDILICCLLAPGLCWTIRRAERQSRRFAGCERYGGSERSPGGGRLSACISGQEATSDKRQVTSQSPAGGRMMSCRQWQAVNPCVTKLYSCLSLLRKSRNSSGICLTDNRGTRMICKQLLSGELDGESETRNGRSQGPGSGQQSAHLCTSQGQSSAWRLPRRCAPRNDIRAPRVTTGVLPGASGEGRMQNKANFRGHEFGLSTVRRKGYETRSGSGLCGKQSQFAPPGR